MKIKYFLLLSFLSIFSYSVFTFASVAEQSANTIKSELHQPIKILEFFFQAVSRDELIVFGKSLDKSILIPIRVEYIYELDGSKPTVMVYSELKYLLDIPTHSGIKLRGVSTILNDVGRIIEVRAHVIPTN